MLVSFKNRYIHLKRVRNDNCKSYRLKRQKYRESSLKKPEKTSSIFNRQNSRKFSQRDRKTTIMNKNLKDNNSLNVKKHHKNLNSNQL